MFSEDDALFGLTPEQVALLRQGRLSKGMCPECGGKVCCGVDMGQALEAEKAFALDSQAGWGHALLERNAARRSGPWVEHAGEAGWLVMAPPPWGIYTQKNDIRYLVLGAKAGTYAWGTAGLVYFPTKGDAQLAAIAAPPWWPDVEARPPVVRMQDQTAFPDVDGYGNCTQAAIATLLGLPLAAVPDFNRPFAGQKGARALMLAEVQVWLAERGWAFVDVDFPQPGGLYLADGVSPRGGRHMVVYRGDGIAHDPHPSRAGLVSDVRFAALVPLDPALVVMKGGLHAG